MRLSLEAATNGLIMQLAVKSSTIWPSTEPYDETFALMPSLLQGHTSIDTLSAIFLVA